MSFITDNWQMIVSSLGIGTGGGLLGYFKGRKGIQIKNKTDDANATEAMQKAYATFVKDTNIEIKQLRDEMQAVKTENREQRKDLRDLQKDNANLHTEITQLTKENHRLQNQIIDLQNENKQLSLQLLQYRQNDNNN